MRRVAALAGLALMAGCHRSGAVSDAPDADADLRARTAAKTLADVAAADTAAKAPLPRMTEQPIQRAADRPVRSSDTDIEDAMPENGAE